MRLKQILLITAIIGLVTAIIVLTTELVKLYREIQTPTSVAGVSYIGPASSISTPTLDVIVSSSAQPPKPSVVPATIITVIPFTPAYAPRTCSRRSDTMGTEAALDQLGCPLESDIWRVGSQKFQGGRLLYIENARTRDWKIFALFNNPHSWAEADMSTPVECGDKPYCCEEAGIYGDKNPLWGFAQVWCKFWRKDLGEPAEREQGINDGVVEIFDSGGLVINARVIGKFILYADKTWKE